MDNALYVNLTRQMALARELSTVSNNIANMSTAGFQREGVVFSEFIKSSDGPLGSMSMGAARARYVDTAQGALSRTDSPFDVAIEGDGFFQIQTPDGVRLTRNGGFTTTADNLLSTRTGHLVLDEGGAPIFMPPDAGPIAISPDGSISAGDLPIGRLGILTVEDPRALRREADGLLSTEAPTAPSEKARVAQGFLEDSNVNPVNEISRMIEVQRAYELGQNMGEQENQRIQQTIQTLGRPL